VAVIVKLVTCWVLVLLISVPDIGEPDPDAAIPVILVKLSLDHEKVVPVILFGFEIAILLIAFPEQIV